MKRTIPFLFILLFCFPVFSQTEEAISLKDAVKQRLLTVNGSFNEKSVHYIQPVVLILVSLVKRPLKIKVEAGDIMEPADSSCQTMLITRDMIVGVPTGKSITIEPYAMCTEPHDGAGRSGLKYFFKRGTNSKLKEIARYINDNALTGFPAQEAVWCVADKSHSLLDINGYDSVGRLKLIAKVASITGKKMPSIQEITGGYNDYVKPPTETVGGMFEYKFSKTAKVHIAMFNAQGTVVRELYYNASEKPGVHTINFEFDYAVYTDEYYEIKLIANEEVMMSSRIDRDNDNWIEDDRR